MKFFLISDNTDTLVGMRLAGIEGVIVHERDEFLAALERACNDNSIAILLITQKLSSLAHEEVERLKLESRRPLLTEIPDRHGESGIAEKLEEYIGGAIGVKFG